MTRKHWVYSMALLLCVLWMSPALFAQVSVGISVGFAPPPLPVYEQPICPGDGYIWTPGYWDWDGDDYYWVPGTWVEAAGSGLFVDPGMVGMGRKRVPVSCRILGAASRVVWRNQLWIRLLRARI